MYFFVKGVTAGSKSKKHAAGVVVEDEGDVVVVTTDGNGEGGVCGWV